MARSVGTGAQNRFLQGVLTTGVTSATSGCTFVIWSKPSATNIERVLFEARPNNTTENTSHYNININSSGRFRVSTKSGTGLVLNTAGTTTATAGTWYHLAGTFFSTSRQAIWVNGVKETEQSESRLNTSMPKIGVGGRPLSLTTATTHGNGAFAEAALYNVELTADEIAALASGVTPLEVRPHSLIAYWPLSLGNNDENRNEASVAGQRVTLTPQTTGVTVVAHAPVRAPTQGRRVWVPYVIQGGGGAEVITGTDPDALTLATAQGTVHVGAVVTGTAPAALALSGVQGQATQGQQVTGAPDDLTLATVAGQVFVGSVVEGATEALTLQTYQGAVEEIPDVPTVDGVTETLALSTAQGAVEVGALVEGQVEALTLTTAPGEALAGVFLDGSSEALSLQTQPGQALTGVAVEGQTEALTLQTYPGTIDLENPVIVTGVTESLTLATNPGAATPGALVEGQTEALALTTYRGTVGTVIAARFGGGFYTRKHRKIPRTADDREELRALLTEAFDGPAQEPVKALLRAAEPELGVSPRSWAKPSTKALDALMGRAEVIQQVLTLIWEAEEREEAQRRDEEHLLLLMVL